jgi:4a-hydroxytetrahydrobiopterin dehydratase
MAEHRKLADSEIHDRLQNISGWEFVDGKLHRELRFPDFASAFGFMTKIALAAEAADHHPEWLNVYNRVVVDLSTHDVGGISEKDFALARVIDRNSGDA